MLPPWNRKKTLSTKAHQEIIDQVNRNSEFTSTGDIYRGQDGNTIIDARVETYFLRCEAVVIAPEDSDHTYDDPRYRCRIQRINYGQVPEDLVKFIDQDDIQEQLEGATDPQDSEEIPTGWTVTATNLPEIQDPITGAGSHNLPEDGTVVVEIYARRAFVGGEEGDLATTDVIRWFFTSGGVLPVGEFYGMVYGDVTDRRGGFFFPPIVSVPPGF